MLGAQILSACVFVDAETRGRAAIPADYGSAQLVSAMNGENCMSAVFKLSLTPQELLRKVEVKNQPVATSNRTVNWSQGPLPDEVFRGESLLRTTFALGVACESGLPRSIYDEITASIEPSGYYYDIYDSNETIVFLFPKKSTFLVLGRD